ncbi:MAG: hypothetical protein KJ915_09260 [Candidatus Omnitrophica bacterium]|nr:hypothetical protein [Candidatus Omnitrophota bacterium]
MTEVEELGGSYTAVVLGTKPYRVSVSAHNFKHGHCTCYLGGRDRICKHMVALALYAAVDGQPLKNEDKQQTSKITCSDNRDILNKANLAAVKKSITDSMRYIKPYRGPSNKWFANQDSLQEGCNRLREILYDLPVNRQSADLLVKLLLRLEKKLSAGGVDDSNGIVGQLVAEIVALLEKFAQIVPICISSFKPLCGKEYCFGWEDSLVRIYDETIS